MGVKSTHSHLKDGSDGQFFFSNSGGKLIEFARTIFLTGPETATGDNFDFPAGISGGTIFQYNGKTIHAFTASGQFRIVDSVAVTKNCEIFMIAGGGGAPWCSGSGATGGGGAGGAVHYSSVSISNGIHPVIIGAGGAGQTDPGLPPGGNHGADATSRGNDITFGTAGAIGARGGGSAYSWSVAGTPTEASKALYVDGGCGGGGGGFSQPDAQGKGFADNPYPNPGGTEYGHPAGAPGSRGVAGGGGIGGAGLDGLPGIYYINGVAGGYGLQLPATFRDPSNPFGAAGPPAGGGGNFWVGGGGASGTWGNSPWGVGGGGPVGGTGPYSGGGNGGSPNSPVGVNGENGHANTGGGAGACFMYHPFPPGRPYPANNGGSGLLLLAYPT